jgi:hypothetical protein
MQWTQNKKYLAVFLAAVVVGGLLYGGKQYLALRELARLDAMRIDGGFYSTPLLYAGAWYMVPPREVYDAGLEEGSIPALINPHTMTPAEADAVIADDLGGVSVEINGEARFYPVQIMNWHQVVHDTLGGKHILVYYAPLSGAAAVYELPEEMSFVVSAKEYNNDVLLHQEGSETYWSGILGSPVIAATEADLQQSLTLLSSTFMTWGEWKDIYDNGSVLSTDTGYVRDYTRHPYGAYETSPGVYFPVNHSAIPVRAKEPAYVVQGVQGSSLFINTVSLLDQTPTLATETTCYAALRNEQASYMQIFDCRVDGRALTLTRESTDTFIDAETGSTWSADGVAIDGKLQGMQLVAVPAVRMYTFAADALYPAATIFGSEFVFTEDDAVESMIETGAEAVIEGENVDGATIEVLPAE